MKDVRRWLSTTEKVEHHNITLPSNGNVVEFLDTYQEVSRKVGNSFLNKDMFDKWKSSQEQSLSETSTPLQPINRSITTPTYRQTVRTPNFRKCVRDGMIVMNPYSVSKTEGEVPLVFVAQETKISETRSAYAAYEEVRTYQRIKHYPRGSPHRFTIYAPLLTTQTTYYSIHEMKREVTDIQLDSSHFTLESQDTTGEVSLSNMKNRTLLSLWNEAHSGIFDLLTNLAESKETAKAIVDMRKLPQLLLSYKRALMKGNFRKRLRKTAGQVGDHSASAWLIYRLGILPVDASIKDAIDAVNRARNIKFQTYRNGESSTMDVFLNYRSKDGRFKLLRRSSFTYKVNNVLKCKLEGSSVPPLTINAPMTLWELVPYSFVVDRFINLGDHIQRLGNRSHSVSIGGCQSVKTIETHTVELMIHPDYQNNHVFETGNASDYSKNYSRTVVYVRVKGSPVVMKTSSLRRETVKSPPINSLAINFDLTTNQKMDHLALIWSNIRNKIRSIK